MLHTLTAILFLLKVFEVIEVSWWIVLAPSLLAFSFFLFMACLVFIFVWKAVDEDR